MSPCLLLLFMVLWHTFMRFMDSTYEGKHMPPHHGDSFGNHTAIEATDAEDQEKVTGVGEGPWIGTVEEEATAKTTPVFRAR